MTQSPGTEQQPPSEGQNLRESLGSRVHDSRLHWSTFRDQQRLVVPHSLVLSVMRELRSLGMDQLVDVTAVDLLEYPNATDRFEVVYLLLNTES
ncbi:MAG: NADH-quinone oxidoreductase subunit C, partial [Planctomycetota bacterium]